MSISYHIEISTEHPRSVSRRRDRFELVQKGWPKLREGWSIDIGNEQGEVRGGRGEKSRDSISSGGGASGGKKRVWPSRKDTPT